MKNDIPFSIGKKGLKIFNNSRIYPKKLRDAQIHIQRVHHKLIFHSENGILSKC